jgi:uncharacterized membrane protein YtjA (UPF0391 family)
MRTADIILASLLFVVVLVLLPVFLLIGAIAYPWME